MNNNNFKDVLARAQKLMLSEDFNKNVERSAAMQRGKGNGDDLSLLEAQAFGTPYNGELQEQVQATPTYTQGRMNLDRLPAGLRESFAKNPPMSGGPLDPNELGDISPLGQITEALSVQTQQKQQKHTVSEQISPSNNSGIDYSLLRTIIDECVKRNLAQVEKKMLNENTVKGFSIGAGNKVQFVTNKGDLYEGVLKLKRRKQ